MSTKKTARARRDEREKERQGRRRRGRLTLAVFIVGALLVVLATALIFGTGASDPDDNLVWSAAHGHWHRR